MCTQRDLFVPSVLAALVIACSGEPGGSADDTSSGEGPTGGVAGSTSGSAESAGGTAEDADGTADDASGPGGTEAGGSTGPELPSECDDGIDNDGDGFVDWQLDQGCYGPADATEAAVSRDEEDGFTTFDIAPDSIAIWVSAEGDDADDGLSRETAVATLARAAELVRDGEHDFMLLRRGDTWRDETLGRFKSGRDAAHPLVIAGWGESMQLPRIEVTGHFIDHDGQARSHVALVGLHFVSYPGDPDDPAFDGAPETMLRYVGGGTGLLVEGCHFEYGEIVVQSIGDRVAYDGVEVRRNVIERAYHADTCTPGDPNGNFAYRPSGLYASHAAHLTIEGNVLDHNGWNLEEDPTACATIYNHNLYVNGNDMVIRDNILARASSIQIKTRSDTPGDMNGLRVENNFFVEGEIGISLGGNSTEPFRFVDSEFRGNVMTDIGRSQPTGRTLAWAIDVQDNDGLVVADNLVLNQRHEALTNSYGLNLAGGSGRAYQIEDNLFFRLQGRAIRSDPGSHTEIVVTGNEIVDLELGSRLIEQMGAFAGYTYQGNRYASSAPANAWFLVEGQGAVDLDGWIAQSGEADAEAIAPPAYPDPERDAESYAAAIDVGTSLDELLAAARGQTRLTWRHDLTAPAINDWVRAGFGR